MAKHTPAFFWKLFSSTFLLSAFTFGGGYVIVPLMRKKFVEELGWLEEQEMLDLTAISQSAPGPIAVNAAILVGYRVAGLAGAAMTILGTVLPPLAVLSAVSVCYAAFSANPMVQAVLGGMQAGVAAVIVDVVWDMGRDVARTKDAFSVILMAAVFLAAVLLDVNVAVLILICGGIGALRALASSRKKKKGGAA